LGYYAVRLGSVSWKVEDAVACENLPLCESSSSSYQNEGSAAWPQRKSDQV
jgi:hypothetical protein